MGSGRGRKATNLGGGQTLAALAVVQGGGQTPAALAVVTGGGSDTSGLGSGM